MTVTQQQVDKVTHIALSTDGVFKTLQGEGPRLGRPTTFIRLAGCNLACSWCDTSYTWDWTGHNGTKYYPQEQVRHVSVIDLAQEVNTKMGDTNSITITGGEPLLQQKALVTFFKTLFLVRNSTGTMEVNFETNGTIYPEWESQDWDFSIFNPDFFQFNYVVSPKLTNSGPYNSWQNAVPGTLDSLSAFSFHADFKFVCDGPTDLEEVDYFLGVMSFEAYLIKPSQVWIMPQGVEPGLLNERAKKLAPICIEKGWNLTPRMHVNLWGNERAR
jgi:organic radical activating enzyme